MTVINPFDFFVEPYADEFPFKYEPWLAKEVDPTWKREPVGPQLRVAARSIDRTPAEHGRLPGRFEPAAAAGNPLPDPHGTGRADRARRRSSLRVRFVPRHGLAAGADPAATSGLAARFVSGYLIQLAPDVKSLDGPSGPRTGFHRPARLDRGLPPGCRLDRTGSRPPACWPAKGTFRWPARPTRPAAAPITGGVEECETEFEFSHVGDPHPRRPAGHQAVQRRAMAADSARWAGRSTGDWTTATCG